jgi:hypothetical protein
MGLSCEQAIQRLQKVRTPEQLRDLINKIDVQGSGKITLLWSGPAGLFGPKNTELITSQGIAGALNEINPDYRIMANTEVCKFLDLSPESKNYNSRLAKKLDSVFSGDPAKITQFLYGVKNEKTDLRVSPGIWDDVSRNFVKQAKGDVRLVVGGGGMDRVFAQTEVQALLDNPAVKTVEGVPIAYLRNMAKKDINSVTSLLMAVSEVNTSMIKLAVDELGIPIANMNGLYRIDGSDFIKMSSVNPVALKGMRPLMDFIPLERRARHINAINDIHIVTRLMGKDGYFTPSYLDPRGVPAVVGRVANVAGFVGDVLSISTMAYKATSEMRVGRHQDAHHTVSSWAFETAGGLVAGRVATAVVGPLMATGPIGFLGGAAIIIAASFFGGEFMKNLLKKKKETLIREVEIIEVLISPLVLDLDGNGIETLSLKHTFLHFDHDNNGFFERTGWVGPNDGLLVLDLNGNGKIDNGLELFGNNTLLADGLPAEDGFFALEQYDSNKDSFLTDQDLIWNRLRVWRDQNSNAQTDPGELLTMAELQIKAMQLYNYTDKIVDDQGNTHLQHSIYLRQDGQRLALTDVWFAKDALNSLPSIYREVDEDTAALPDLPGIGIVPSLHQAMMDPSNPSLKPTLLKWLGASRQERLTLSEELLFQWTNASVNPFSLPGRCCLSTDPQINQKLAVVEKLYGDRMFDSEFFLGINRSNAVSSLSNKMAFFLDMELSAEVTIKPLFKLAIPVDSESYGPLQLDFSESLKYLRSQFQRDPDPTLIPMIQWQFLHLDAPGQLVFQELQTLAAETDDDLNRAMRLQRVETTPWEWSRGSAGHDELTGTANNDLIEGGPSYDYIWGLDGDDTIHGGPDRDFYYGGQGGDTYLISQNVEGDFDTILDEGSDVNGRPDRVIFWDFASKDVSPVLEGDRVTFYPQANSVLPTNQWLRHGIVSVQKQLDPQYRIEEFHFADGVVWSFNTLLLNLPQPGTEGDDKISGSSTTSNRLHGLAGNDSLIGGALSDHLEGQLGHDRLTGLGGEDTLIGGPGDDTLEGGEGGDTYVFAANSGNDRISDLERRFTTEDKLVFPDLATTSLTRVARTGQSLRLSFGSSGSVLLVNQLQPLNRIESFVFANGMTWDHDTLLAQVR